jgi:hypothetical protein
MGFAAATSVAALSASSVSAGLPDVTPGWCVARYFSIATPQAGHCQAGAASASLRA